MREIKLRIRLKSNYKEEFCTLYNSVFDLNTGIAFYPINKDEWDILSVDEYTGLKDKNGKEIYEGDVLIAYDYVNYDNIKSVVKWIEHKCGFFPQEQEVNKFGGNYLSYWDQIQDIEIIGNIHENPELIK